MATNAGARVLNTEIGKKKDMILFPCEDVPNMIARLLTLGVDAKDQSVRKPEKVRGVAVERWQMAQLLKVFGLTEKDVINAGQTEVPNLTLVKRGDGRKVEDRLRAIDREIIEKALAKVEGNQVLIPMPPPPPQKKKVTRPTTLEEIRAAFIEMTGTKRLQFLLDELPGAVREANKATNNLISIERDCQSALAALVTSSLERRFLEQKIAEECRQLLEMGVEIEGNPQVVCLRFFTDKGLRKLRFGADQLIVIADDNFEAIELPAEIFVPVIGFVARHDFIAAVRLLKNYFANDEEETKHG